MSQKDDLISAISNGSVDLVREILHSSGLDGQPDLRGQLLLLAIEEDQTDVAKFLCCDGLWSKVVRSDDLAAIHVACKYGNVEIIETLLRNGAAVNEQTPDHRLTPLLMAVRWRQREAVCHLLDSGADPNLPCGRYKQLTSPLHEAVATLNEDIINYLLGRNADINLLNGLRQIPLHIICGIRYISGDGLIKDSVRERIAKRLISCGSDINSEDLSGNTPLHLAVNTDSKDDKQEIVQLLCVSGAFINTYNQAGESPLHRVAMAYSSGKRIEQCIATVRLLVNFGANVNKEAVNGRVPLQMALLGQFNPQLADILIDAGADINHTDPHGQTVFHRTVMDGPTCQGLRYLIRKGVNYDTVSRKDMSPLTSACGVGDLPTIHLICSECPALLDPRKRIPDVSGRPLHCVARLLNFDMFNFFLNAGYKWTRQELQYLLEWPNLSTKLAILIKGLLENGEPNALKTICRDTIRTILKDDLWNRVRSLPLPEVLKKHLLLHDLEVHDSLVDYAKD